jgi:hypothetical protein
MTEAAKRRMADFDKEAAIAISCGAIKKEDVPKIREQHLQHVKEMDKFDELVAKIRAECT